MIGAETTGLLVDYFPSIRCWPVAWGSEICL